MRSDESCEESRFLEPILLATISALVLLSSGCVPSLQGSDHFDRLDRISVRAGDAQARNITIQSVNPMPDERSEPHPSYDGRRAMAVMDRYYGNVDGARMPSRGATAAVQPETTESP